MKNSPLPPYTRSPFDTIQSVLRLQTDPSHITLYCFHPCLPWPSFWSPTIYFQMTAHFYPVMFVLPFHVPKPSQSPSTQDHTYLFQIQFPSQLFTRYPI